MATASTTANQALCSTYEKENYQRLSRLIMGAGTVLFRAVFDYFYPPSSLGSKLREPGTRQELDKVLLKPQRALVYPASGLCGESKDFDISLLSTLLKILCRTQLPPLSSGWNHSPATDDESLTADIVRVKLYRNDIIHKFHRGELSDAKFCSLWDKIKTTLLRIASFISAETSREWEDKIEKFRHDPLTPEAERNAEELQKWDQKDMDTKECLVAGFARVERQIQSSSEEGRERFDRLEREIQDQRNEIEKLRELVTNRDSSSLAEGEASVRIIIYHDVVGSLTSAQVEQLIQRTASEMRRHFDPSINEENQFVQRLEDIIQVVIINVSHGSLVLTVKCTSLEILERLWQDYSSGHLGKVAQEFLVTDKVLEDLGLVELKLRITVLEEDYRECRRHFTKCAGADFPNKREGEQKKDGREDECISSQDLTGFARMEGQIESSTEEGKERLERLEKEIQDLKKEIQHLKIENQDQKKENQDQKNKIEQLHEMLMNRPSSSLGEVGGSDYPYEREEEQKEDNREDEYIPSQHPTGSDFPDKREGEQREDDREDECISSQDLTGNNANQVPVVNVNRDRLLPTVKGASLEVQERFWQDYSSGELGKVAQESPVTDKGLEYLGPLEPKRLKITVPEEDYREGRRHFTKSAGFDNSDEREGEQNEDHREEEYIPSQHSTGICRNLSLLPRTVTHFVNRETECQKIKDYLSPLHNCRCLLIHGATGMGKTTVAIKAANDIHNPDGRTMVIYVNCRDIKLHHDFASKVLQQVYHYPVEDPVAELKNRLKSQDFSTILFLDNFEFLHHLDDRKQTRGNKLSPQQMNPSEEGLKIKKLLNVILMDAEKVKLLLTSSVEVSFPEAGQEKLPLSPFRPEESVELLKKVWKDKQVDTTQAHDLSEICCGIPLVLFTLASSHSGEMNSSPHEKFEFLGEILQKVQENKKITVCIDYCFERLDYKEKCALISFALFRRRFSLHEAEQMFQSTRMRASELRECGLELSRRSLLEECSIGDGSFYTLLEVIRDYCEKKAEKHEFLKVISDARRMFTRHFLTFLEDTFRKFLSQNVSEAIAAFQMDEGNVLQLVEWCSNEQMDVGQMERCIDVFNSVAELLAKMMGEATFKYTFESFQRRCEQMKDQKRLSDCLTSLGIEEVFRGSNHPTGLRAVAAQKAKAYLTEADQIQCNLKINSGNSRAQCLAKLARCLAIEYNFDEAKEKVRQAIKIRLDQGEDDKVMLGATYNDQAVILSLEENHWLAIEVREKQTRPIYTERLGEHPFTATILNSLSNNYYALGKYDDAEVYSKEALVIRRKLLENHRDTAKSLFDLGMIHKMKEEFKPARNYLKECEAMQKRILDENDDDLTSTRKKLEEVKRRLAEAEGQSNESL